MSKNVIFYISFALCLAFHCNWLKSQGHIKVKFSQYVLLSIVNGSGDLYVLRMVHFRRKGVLLNTYHF